MSKTKKLLVPFDPAKPTWNPSEFLIPALTEGKPAFAGLTNRKIYEFGRMVYIGMAVSENDLFAKLVDSGAFIENVDETLACLRSYVTQLQSLKIGNIVRIVPADAGSSNLFGLELVAQTPSGVKI